MFEKSLQPNKNPELLLSETEKTFLDKRYLVEAYLIDRVIKEKFAQIHTEIKAQFPDIFISIAIVGSLVNGSYLLRKGQVNSKPSDADYYLIGRATDDLTLLSISKMITQKLKEIKISSDGYLDGSHHEMYVNVDDIDGIIERGDINLLATVFQFTTGEVREVQKKIIEHILKHPDKEKVWSEFKNYYQQSLMMGHGSWPEDFNNMVLNEYYPEKLKKFDLPDSPEEMLKNYTN